MRHFHLVLIWSTLLLFQGGRGYPDVLDPIESEENTIVENAEYEEPAGSRPARGARRPMGVMGYYKCKAPDGYLGSCKPRATCASYYSTVLHYDYNTVGRYRSCTYGYGYRGVCCPEVVYHAPGKDVIKIHYKARRGYNSDYRDISPDQIQAAVRFAYHEIYQGFTRDKDLGRGEDDDSYWGNGVIPELYMPELHKLGWTGFFLALVSTYLTREYGYNPASGFDGGLKLNKYIHLFPPEIQEVCGELNYKKCSYSKYRSIDGSCNNLKFPFWGQARTATMRLAVPEYSDGVYGIKRAGDGGELPHCRVVRSHTLPEKDVAERDVNSLFMVFGQIVVHDAAHTIFYQGNEGDFLDCCHGYQGGYQQVSPKCIAIGLPPDDNFYSRMRVPCLNLARIMVAPNPQCTAGYANQLNRQTSHLDLSLVYGTNQNESDNLRTGNYGTLKMSKVGSQYMLPLDKNAECFNTSNGFCMTSGDLRDTIHPGITLFQTLLNRNHNYCAKKIYRLNPHWNDEKIFQECRRLNIAVFQHIVYNEYLPLLLGYKFMYDHGLLPVTKGYSYDYDEYVNPSVLAEFTGAAGRCHSTVYGKLNLMDEYYNIEKVELLSDHYNDPSIFKDGENFDKLLRGYVYTPQRKLDAYYDPLISLYLLRDQRHFGLDIGSMNIQRGRDFALRSYNDYREMCGLKRAYAWSDFYDWIEPYNVELLKRQYRHVDHVELYVAGLMERHQYDSTVGPTWWCIIGQQFVNWKRGDRFFYDLGDQPHSFSLGQLDQIRHMSLASLLCTLTHLKHVPAFAFHTISDGNPLVPCSDYEAIPRLQFGPWRASKYRK